MINNRIVHGSIFVDEALSSREDAKRADMKEGLANHWPFLYFCVVRGYIFLNFEAFHRAAISRK